MLQASFWGNVYVKQFISRIAFCPIAQKTTPLIPFPINHGFKTVFFMFRFIEKFASSVFLMYCTIFRHYMLALAWSCSSNTGMVSSCVQIRSAVVFIVSLSGLQFSSLLGLCCHYCCSLLLGGASVIFSNLHFFVCCLGFMVIWCSLNGYSNTAMLLSVFSHGKKMYASN